MCAASRCPSQVGRSTPRVAGPLHVDPFVHEEHNGGCHSGERGTRARWTPSRGIGRFAASRPTCRATGAMPKRRKLSFGNCLYRGHLRSHARAFALAHRRLRYGMRCRGIWVEPCASTSAARPANPSRISLFEVARQIWTDFGEASLSADPLVPCIRQPTSVVPGLSGAAPSHSRAAPDTHLQRPHSAPRQRSPLRSARYLSRASGARRMVAMVAHPPRTVFVSSYVNAGTERVTPRCEGTPDSMQ